MKTKKAKLLIIALVLVTLTALVALLTPNKHGRNFFQEVKYKQLLASSSQPNNYDKMKISYAEIVKRKTGTPDFNDVSDLDGHDSSPDDNYLRTLDTLEYTVEVGIGLNLDNPDVTETTSLTGGVIKIQATIPEVNGKAYFAWKEFGWMSGHVIWSDDGRTMTITYGFDSTNTIIGGNQQFTFLLQSESEEIELTPEQMPTFKVWMDGNKPDNNNSLADPVSVQDPNGLILTGDYSASIRVSRDEPTTNLTAVRDSKIGQYLNFGIDSLIGKSLNNIKLIGTLYPQENENNAEIEIKLKYSYKDAASSNYIDVNSPTLNDAVLIAYNKTGITNEDAYPLNTSNNMYVNMYLEKESREYQNDILYESKYGDIEAILDGDVLKLKIKGFSNNLYNVAWLMDSSSQYVKSRVLFSDSIELFIPHYMPEENTSYDYKLEYEITSAKLVDDDGNEVFDILTTDNTNDNKNTYSFRNYLKGETKTDIFSDTKFTSYSGNPFEDAYTYEGNISTITSQLMAMEGPYLGGEKRLITFDSSKLELVPKDDKWYELEEANPKQYSPNTSAENQKLYFGIYKSNSSVGLNSNALVNSTMYEDFDWYITAEEAKEHGVITALSWENPDYNGYSKTDNLKFYIKAVDTGRDKGEVPIIRHKIWLYKDINRNQVIEIHTSNSENSFSGSTFNESYRKIKSGSPAAAGEGILITEGYIEILTSGNYRKKQGSGSTGTFSVQEEKILFDIRLSPYKQRGNIVESDNFYAGIDFKDQYLTLLPDTCNVPLYSETRKSTNTIRYIWRIEDFKYSDLPTKITCEVLINPLTPNNTIIETNVFSNGKTDHYGFNELGGTYRTEKITIVNLSGSSTRKIVSNNYIEKEENINVTGNINNISDDSLNNVKIIELLPKNGDSRGSIIDGDYTITINNIDEGTTVYYSTGDIDSIGIETDNLGYKNIKNVDLENDSRWIQVAVGGIIPSNATAIATYTGSVLTQTSKSFSYTLNPTGNKGGNVYYFGQYASSDNLVENIFSTYKKVSVVSRRISGKVFEDINRSDIYNSSDALIKDYVVELLDESGAKIAETTTDTNGYYELVVPDKGKYYVRFANLPKGYELTPKGTTENHNKVNSTMKTDLINHTESADEEIEMIGNINLGIRKKAATLTIKYLDKNNDQPLADEVTSTVYYTDTYEAKGLTTIPENYSFLENSGDPVTGTVDKDNIVVTYYYDYTPATITARHYIDGTTTKIHEDVIQNKKLTQPYETSKLTFADYDYVRTDGDAESGTISKTNIVVNYYYKLKTGTVITHHYLYDNGDTTTKLAPDVSKEWNYTDTYTTSTSDEVPQNYEFYKKSDNFTSVMSSPNVEVKYYYRLKDSNLTTSITKTGPEEITSKDAEVNYTITYNAVVGEYIGNGTITIVDTLPYKIDIDASDLDGGTYNETNKTITWTREWNNISSYNEELASNHLTITKNIKIVYSDLNPKDRVMTNTTKGTITLSNNTRDAQAQTSTNIKIKGKIKVIYIDVDTEEELFDTVEEENLVGETFISEAHEKDGYRLVKKPDSETYEFEEEDQLITYGYEHIKYEVKGVVLGEGGSITGDEDVFWGEDSTEGNIIIKADPGYVIESVIINGEEIDIEPGKEEMVLGQFLQMKENKNIEVSFIKKPTENPNTRSFIGILSLVLSILVISILFIKRKTFRKNRYEQ